MAKFYSFPHYKVNVKDESNQTTLIVEDLPLHRPMFLSTAEKGPVGVPFWGSYDEISTKFGKGTFDYRSLYFQHPNVFLAEALKIQKAFFVRLAPSDAAIASLVIEAHVYTSTHLPVWTKDVDTSARIVDVDGNWVQAVDPDTLAPLWTTGVVVVWKARALADNESASTLTPSATTCPKETGAGTYAVDVYPVMVLTYKSPCAAGNNAGLKLYWPDDADTGMAVDMQALPFRFEPVEIPYGLANPLAIYNKFDTNSDDFTFKTDTVDPSTTKRYFLDDVLIDDYNPTNMPFDIVVYSANIETIGNACIAVESTVNFPEILNAPFMVNLFTGKTTAGVYYDKIMIDPEPVGADTQPITGGILMDQDVVHYMVSGSDGTIGAAAVETLTAEWMTGLVYPDIVDSARYPVTHIYDSGYSMATKNAVIDFLGVKDDVKVVISTQEVISMSGLGVASVSEANTKAEDGAAGSSLRARILLHPESYIYGTEACRGSIFQQCGRLSNNPYNKLVPATADSLIKRCRWQGSISLKGLPKGLPNSAVTDLKDVEVVSWFPTSNDHKQSSWDQSLNYMQYYDMTSYHYPDTVAVYPYKSSVMSDDIFVDCLVYLKHIARVNWSIFSGRNDSKIVLFGLIAKAIDKDIYEKLTSGVPNFIRVSTSVYQTDVDASLGYAATIDISVYGTVPNRVHNVILRVKREATV